MATEVAHRTFYGEELTTCVYCGQDWYDESETPKWKTIWRTTDSPVVGNVHQSVWGVNCPLCGEYYAQINLYSALFKGDSDGE